MTEPVQVTVRSYKSIAFGTRYALERVVDQKTEASGYTTAADAEEYAVEQGLIIVASGAEA